MYLLTFTFSVALANSAHQELGREQGSSFRNFLCFVQSPPTARLSAQDLLISPSRCLLPESQGQVPTLRFTTPTRRQPKVVKSRLVTYRLDYTVRSKRFFNHKMPTPVSEQSTSLSFKQDGIGNGRGTSCSDGQIRSLQVRTVI